MKKLLIGLIAILFAVPAYASTLTLHTNMSADATIAGFNNNFQQISDWANGNVEGSAIQGSTVNILADSIGEGELGDDINPRIRTNEILGVGSDDTTSDQSAVVTTGMVASDPGSTLYAELTAGTVYIDGYRIAVGTESGSTACGATKDCYVDYCKDTGYVATNVTIDGEEPAMTETDCARVAKFVTNGTEITSATDLANRAVPGLVIPVGYRDGLLISGDSVNVIHVDAGRVEINGAMVTKATGTKLTLTTAADWAAGTDGRLASTMGYVGIDDSGNLDLSTTAPAYANYDVSQAQGVKKYATWTVSGGTEVYRILGYFYMNAAKEIKSFGKTLTGVVTGYNVGNIKEHGAWNTIGAFSDDAITVDDTDYSSTDLIHPSVSFYSTGRPVTVLASVSADSASNIALTYDLDGTIDLDAEIMNNTGASQAHNAFSKTIRLQQGAHTIRLRGHSTSGNSFVTRQRSLTVREE